MSPTSRSVPAEGEEFEVRVAAGPQCEWTAESRSGWLTVLSGSPGTGNGRVRIAAARNTTPGTRTGSLVVAGTTVEVTQAAPPSSSVSIEGEVSGVSGGCPTLTFVIDGPVDLVSPRARTTVTTGQETAFSGGACNSLRNGDEVRVYGTMGLDGQVAASRVEFVRH